MNSRSRSRRSSLGFSLGSASSTGLSSSYAGGLSSGGYGNGSYFSSGYSPSYTGHTNYLTKGNSYVSSSTTGKDHTRLSSTSGYNSVTSPNAPYSSRTTGTSSRRYTGSKTASDIPSVPERVGSAPSSGSGWRSKSMENTNGYRDRSMSRDPYTSARDRSVSRDYKESSVARDTYLDSPITREAPRERSLARDTYRDLAKSRDTYTPSRDSYTPSRDLGRSGSSGPDSIPLSSSRSRRNNDSYFNSSVASRASAYSSSSDRFNAATSNNSYNNPRTQSSIVRSNSFRDLRELNPSSAPSTPRMRARHQTLAYGVSELDLQRASALTRSAADIRTGMDNSSYRDRADRSAADISAMGYRGSEIRSSGADLSSKAFRGSSSDLRSIYSDQGWMGSNRDLHGLPSFDIGGAYGPSATVGLNGYSKSITDLGYGSLPASRRDSNVSVGEKSSSNHSGPAAKSNIKSQNGDIDYKKLWEESQTENARLRHDMNTIKEDLSSTRHQLDAAIQASTKNAVSDAEKREKKLLEKKLAEMEEELKQLQKLKAENEKLKSENRALTRVVSKLTAAVTKAGPGPASK